MVFIAMVQHSMAEDLIAGLNTTYITINHVYDHAETIESCGPG